MKWISNNWLLIVPVLILIWLYIHSAKQLEKYQHQLDSLDIQLNHYRAKEVILKKQVDSMMKLDAVVVEKIIRIKDKNHAQIKAVDTFTVSDLQEFFTKRY